MSPSRSACPCRILKISSCLRSPPVPWTPRSLATALSSVMVLSLSSDRFILLPPAPPDSDEAASVASDFCGEGRLGLRCEMAISGGVIVYGVLDEPTQRISHKHEGDVNTKAPPQHQSLISMMALPRISASHSLRRGADFL